MALLKSTSMVIDMRTAVIGCAMLLSALSLFDVFWILSPSHHSRMSLLAISPTGSARAQEPEKRIDDVVKEPAQVKPPLAAKKEAPIPKAAPPSTQLWATFPRTNPGWIATTAKEKGCLSLSDHKIFYAVWGEGEPVLFVHGGLATSDIWEAQVPALADKYKVIVADSRGHGRSSRKGGEPMHYRSMTDDLVRLLDHLKLASVAVVGWSDGGIIGLDMAMRYPNRVNKLFAHAANTDPSGLMAAGGAAWSLYLRWAQDTYAAVGPERCDGKPDYAGLRGALSPMWRNEPRWTRTDLAKVKVPTAVALGTRDEAISCRHTLAIAAAIPDAKVVLMKDLGHFALRQDPATYNKLVRSFLDGSLPRTAPALCQQ